MSDKELARELLKALRWVVYEFSQDKRAMRKHAGMFETIGELVKQGEGQVEDHKRPPLIIPDKRLVCRERII
jgi:hypothetical protein